MILLSRLSLMVLLAVVLSACSSVDAVTEKVNATREKVNDRELEQGIETLCNFATVGAISRRNSDPAAWVEICVQLNK